MKPQQSVNHAAENIYSLVDSTVTRQTGYRLFGF
jgi:hypothetical protein